MKTALYVSKHLQYDKFCMKTTEHNKRPVRTRNERAILMLASLNIAFFEVKRSLPDCFSIDKETER